MLEILSDPTCLGLVEVINSNKSLPVENLTKQQLYQHGKVARLCRHCYGSWEDNAVSPRREGEGVNLNSKRKYVA